jgi:murein DD-endopeptidase MepM/ murein hydrolase activator NlpD
VHQVQATEAQVQADVDQIAAERVQQQAELDQLQTTQNELTQQRSLQQNALAALAAAQKHDEQLAAQWTAVENALNAQIAHLQQEEQAALAAGGGHGHFVWPDTGPITQGFGCTPFTFEAYDPACPTKHFHNGIDIAGPCGNNIVAADSGIAYTEPYDPNGFGNYIIMVHGNGWETLYGHMAGFNVGNGQKVTRGQLIGWEGSTGNSTGCHLHFGVNLNNQWVNPLSYLPSQ